MSSSLDFLIYILKLVYPIQEPDLVRDRPLEVLCLGISRSGTESLSKALYQIGYNDVYHGMQLIDYRTADIAQWWRLSRAKCGGNQDFLNAREFDKVLGHCQAITDFPCCSFATELLHAYPDAKVVLNRRSDVNAWMKSFQSQLFNIYPGWYSRFRPFFEATLFWMRIFTTAVADPMILNHMRRDQDNMADEYRKHYEAIKRECDAQGRQYLEWTVEDGWEPLCKFLEKPIPDGPFPRGNSGAEFQAFRKNVHGPRWRRGNRNVALASCFVVALISWATYTAYRR